MRVKPRALLLAVGALALSPCTARAADAALGLPAMEVRAGNPVTPASVVLGRKLFLDRRLSPNGTMSCAMCHVPEQGFAANELATPVGIEGRSVRRNAPTVLNVGWQATLFHDGRETSLEEQVWSPLLARNEMGNPSRDAVVERIASLADYRGLFEAAFDGRGPSAQRLGAALTAYQRSLVAGDSRFDRWRYGGQAAALNDLEQQGFALFTGKGRCSACHHVGERDALLTDHGFHNTGVGARRLPEHTRVELTTGVFAELDRRTIATFAEAPAADAGRYEVTGDPGDRWAYRTPSLRNVALTAPYMHDGSLPTLEAVVDFYDRGGIDNPHKSALIVPLGLTTADRAALAAFLRTLTGSSVAKLAAEARVPVTAAPASSAPRRKLRAPRRNGPSATRRSRR